MISSLPISVSDYLSTSYCPDREYLDGVLVERNMGKWEHSRMQALLTIWFGQHEAAWQIQTATEWRTQVARTRIRIPDVVLVREGSQVDILTDPPLLVIEILSPDDSYSDTEQRAKDYLEMGVQTIWIVDPLTRTARVCSGTTWTEADRLEVAGTPIFVEIATLFARLGPARV